MKKGGDGSGFVAPGSNAKNQADEAGWLTITQGQRQSRRAISLITFFRIITQKSAAKDDLTAAWLPNLLQDITDPDTTESFIRLLFIGRWYQKNRP